MVPRMDKVVDFNMAEAEIKWFVDAKSTLLKTVLTDILGNKTAIILSQMTQVKRLYIFHIPNCISVFQNGKHCLIRVQKDHRMHILAYDSRISYCNFGMCQNKPIHSVVLQGFQPRP
jgi:acetyl-CoA synthetase